MVAQYDSSSSAALFVAVAVGVWLLLALIPAWIAGSKGYSWLGFYLFGLFFFIPALIVSLILDDRTSQLLSPPLPEAPVAAPGPEASPAPGTGRTRTGAPPPGPRALRECPSCREPMRRDASVCPHCRQPSPAWEFHEDQLWWTRTPSGSWVWFDEVGEEWRPENDKADLDRGQATGMAIVESGGDGEVRCIVRSGIIELGDSVEVWRGEELLVEWAVVETLLVRGLGATTAQRKDSCSLSLDTPYDAEPGDVMFAFP